MRQALVFNSIKIRNLTLLLFSFLPAFIFSPRGDVLESHKFISPDGLDWIVEGRILGSDGLVLPVLRNIGYVLSSRLDWYLGGHGFVFALINVLGLFLQGISLVLILEFLKIRPNLQTVGLVIYFGSWIHFSSLYILPDSFAVGCLVFGTTFFAVNAGKNLKRLTISLTILFVGSLFQFYAFAGFVFLIVLMMIWPDSPIARAKRAMFILIVMTSCIGVTILWRNSIPHSSVPSQFDLLAVNLKMLPFYIEIWVLAFLVPIILIIGFSNQKSLRLVLLVQQIRCYIFFSTIFIALALFYQWEDARIAYSGISFSLITLISILLVSIEGRANGSKPRKAIDLDSFRPILVLTFALSLFMAPKDYWSPKLFETRPLHTWSLITSREVLRNESSAYKEISTSIKNNCQNSNEVERILESITVSGFSPYEKTILTTYTRYFPCSSG